MHINDKYTVALMWIIIDDPKLDSRASSLKIGGLSDILTASLRRGWFKNIRSLLGKWNDTPLQKANPDFAVWKQARPTRMELTQCP